MLLRDLVNLLTVEIKCYREHGKQRVLAEASLEVGANEILETIEANILLLHKT